MDGATSPYENILHHFVHGDGKFQRGQFLLLLLIMSTTAHTLYLHLFSVHTPGHRCFVQGCDDLKSDFHANFTNFALPQQQAHGFLGSSSSAPPFMQCSHLARVDPSSTSCQPSDFDSQDQVPCERFVYDQSIFEQTLVTDLNLVCSEAKWAKFISSGVFVGLLTGSLLGGQIADRLGRKPLLLLALVLNATALLIPVLFQANYWLFWTCRVLSALCILFVWLGSKAIALELFGKKQRKLYMVILVTTYYIFGLILPMLAYLERSWKLLHVGSMCAVLVAFPPALLFLEESPRWLALNTSEDQSTRMIAKMAERNGRALSSEEMVELRILVHQMRALTLTQHEHHKGGLGLLDMFRGWQRVRQTLILMLVWIISILTGFSMMFSMENLAGDVFINFSLIILATVPSNLMILTTLDNLGRRYTMALLLVLMSISCCLIAFIDHAKTILVLTLVGRSAADTAANVAWMVTGELYPTNMRTQAMGLCSASSRIVGLLSPFVASLSDIWPPLGLLTLAIPAAIIAVMTLFLPETSCVALQDDLRHRKQHHVEQEMELKMADA